MADNTKKPVLAINYELTLKSIDEHEDAKGSKRSAVFVGKDVVRELEIKMTFSGAADQVSEILSTLRAVKTGASTVSIVVKNQQTTLADFEAR